MGHGADIRDRVRIGALNRRLAKVLEVSPDGVAFFDGQGRLTYLNRAARELYGIGRSQDVAQVPLEVMLGGDEAAATLRTAMAHAKTNGSHTGEISIRQADGTETPLSQLVVSHAASEGTVEFYAVIARDISERIRGERSIRASEQRFRRVVENLQEVLFETDLTGTWTYLNPAWTGVTGFTVEESLGRDAIDFVHSDDCEAYRRRFGPLLRRQKELSRFEIRCRTKGGAARWIEVHARRTEDGDGRPVGTSGTLRDITEQRELSDALVKAGQEALAASRLKSEFVANMSHEVRTPINGVIGLTTLLLDSSLTDDQQYLANGIRSSAEALLTIVNDILDISKIEAGKLSIEPVSFVLRNELQHALEPVAVKAHRKGLTLRLNCASGVPESIVSDPTRIRQVLINLADNAIKFTREGTVTVDVRTGVTAADRPCLRFEVVDSGIGIPAGKLDAIFDKFTQADSSTTRKYGGSGLGLAICRQLVELMGGEIGVKSDPGTGSTFWFELPLMEAVRGSAPAQAFGSRTAPISTGFTVLVAEDNTINQKVARRFLEKLGCTVEIVESGDEALARVREREFDVVFMDCQMPRMDGYEATRRIRRLPERGNLPIVAMTANAMNGDREKCLEAGMSDYLSKPLQPEALAGVLDRVAPRRGPREGSAA